MKTQERKPSVSEQLEAKVRAQSDKRFANFKITELSRSGVYRSWFCADPTSWYCSFTITTIPGILIMTGDLGTLVVERHYDMLPWCRGSCDSTGYFAEKVSREIDTTEFSHLVLEEWINEEIAEIEANRHDDDPEYGEDRMACLQDVLEYGLDDDGQDYFMRHLQPAWEGNDPPNWRLWKHCFLMQRDAIRWFVNHHDEPGIPNPVR